MSPFDIFTRHPRWFKTILMTGFLFSGLLTAIGHHVYYKRLERMVATNQQEQEYNIKVGTALAFLTKAMLSASVGIALTQIVWRTVRSQPYTLTALDKLFAISHSPTNILSFEVLRYAKVVTVVAICFWSALMISCRFLLSISNINLTRLIPFAAITPPGTLSVRIQSYSQTRSDVAVPTFDFEAVAKLGKNASRSGRTALVLTAGASSAVNFYSGPTTSLKGLAAVVAYNKEMLQFSSPCGANCTFPLSFTGPTMKCENVDWNDPAAPWYSSQLGSRLFDMKTQYNATSDKDNNFWAAWAYLPHKVNGTRPFRDVTLGGPAQYGSKFQLKGIKCFQRNTTFNLQVAFKSNSMSIKVVSTGELKPMNFTPTTQGFSQAGQIEVYGGIYATKAIFDTLFNPTYGGLISGAIEERGGAASTTWISSTNLVQTKLAEDWLYNSPSGAGGYIDAFYPVEDLGSAVEELHNNLTFSILARPDIIFNADAKAQATVSGLRNIYIYNSRDLWLSYGAALIVGAGIVVFGLFSLITAGDAHDNGFTSIILAASNPHLDRVLMGAQQQTGRKSTAVEHLKDVKLQYCSRSEEGHCNENGNLEGFVVMEGSHSGEAFRHEGKKRNM